MKAFVLAAALALPISPLAAEEATPAQALRATIMFFAATDACRVPVAADLRSELAAAGQRLQTALGLTDVQIDALAVGIVQDAQRADCELVRREAAVLGPGLLQEARRWAP